MSDPRFPIRGTKIPPMLGREKIMQRIWSSLTKTTPSHLSIVGPRYSGKSVILKALEKRMQAAGSPYCAVILWDLGHQTPRTDEEFLKLLCKRLGEGLCNTHEDYGKSLLAVTSDEYGDIWEVMDALNEEGQKILMLWDGFDKPLSGGMLSRNLWDNLLDLCRKPSFRLVTSTRKELHQLIRDEKSVTSDFWGVFEGIVRVGSFDSEDIDTILKLMPELNFQSGAKTELINWTSGYPPFLCAVLNQIICDYSNGSIDNEMVNQAAINAHDELSPMLMKLWEDCPARAQDLYTVLLERSELFTNKIGKEERSSLVEKGFAEEQGGKMRPACRLLQAHIKGAGPDAGSMTRLFGSWEDYCKNIRSLLERRIAQISRFDDRLYRYVEISISFLPNDPDCSLDHLTSIEDRALDIIWQREFPGGRIIPVDLIAYWTMCPRDGNKIIKGMMENNAWEVPPDRGRQVGLLQLLTGSANGFECKTKVTTKDTYTLVNAIHSYRNRTEHAEGQTIQLGTAVAVIMSCLELLACLDRESHP
ncbi:MAG: hypothetical protein AB2L22_01705 [Syntrophales bacterium]